MSVPTVNEDHSDPITMSKLSCINAIRCNFSAERLERLLLATRPVVENMHSTGTDDAEAGRCSFASCDNRGNV